jgi:hypothetical protein
MKERLIFILTLLPLLTFAQPGITFKIEDLSKPEKSLWLTSPDKVYQRLILSDVNMSDFDIKQDSIDFPFNIVAQNQIQDSLVTFGYHSFFNGMYQAYADHRPFVLSPDMIWLLISQGFAQHVNSNAEQLRSYFVDFKGKMTLIVQNDSIALDDPSSPWETVFPDFTKQIGEFIGKELIDILSCDFSTSTITTKVASDITIMEAMKPYFEFIVIYVICGIPEITLEGTPDDWQKVLNKARALRKYQLDWWIDEIDPILQEFVRASKGKVNNRFWTNMFKYHSRKKYGASKIIDGWIVKFFPYDKDGKRNNLSDLVYRDNLPNEIVKVDFKYIMTNATNTKEIPLELWAGFIGLKQDKETFKLTPQIGWMIRKKDIENKALISKFNSDNSQDWGGIQIRVKTFPKELLSLTQIKTLEIQFLDKIIIPEEISKIKIDTFIMTGSISNDEIQRICKLLPNTKIFINDKQYNTR